MLIVLWAESATKGIALFAAKTFKAAENCIAQLKEAMPNEVFSILSDCGDEPPHSIPRIDENFDLMEVLK